MFQPLSYPNDEDLSLHPNEQKSLAGDPESLGTPIAPEKSERMGTGRSFAGFKACDEEHSRWRAKTADNGQEKEKCGER